jgi:hypothetical protein
MDETDGQTDLQQMYKTDWQTFQSMDETDGQTLQPMDETDGQTDLQQMDRQVNRRK